MMEGEEEEGQSAGTVGANQSRDMGSLTGWQALANEVMAELGSGPQPGASQDQASVKGYEDEEEEMQVAPITTADGVLVPYYIALRCFSKTKKLSTRWLIHGSISQNNAVWHWLQQIVITCDDFGPVRTSHAAACKC